MDSRGIPASPRPGLPKPPLVVDFEEALVRSRPLQEAAISTAVRNPSRIPAMLRSLPGGSSRLWEAVDPDLHPSPLHLPCHASTVEHLRDQKALGRRIILASRNPTDLPDRVATRLGFDLEVVHREGREAFPSATLDRHLGIGDREYVPRPPGPVDPASGRDAIARIRTSWKAVRPAHWSKNLLVLVPVLASHRAGDPLLLRGALLAFASFCTASSLVYLCNDLMDVEADRADPAKRTRPVASGSMSPLHAILLALLLAGATALSASFLPAGAGWALGTYLVANAAYSLRLKRVILLDVFLLAAMHLWRIFTGAIATGIEVSPWLAGFSGFAFLSLAFAKRHVEVVRLSAKGGENRSGRAWSADDAFALATSGIAAGTGGAIVLSLYVTGESFASLYGSPQLVLLLAPLYLYWSTRIWILACRNELEDDPVLFTLRDPASRRVLAFAMAILLLALK